MVDMYLELTPNGSRYNSTNQPPRHLYALHWIAYDAWNGCNVMGGDKQEGPGNFHRLAIAVATCIAERHITPKLGEFIDTTIEKHSIVHTGTHQSYQLRRTRPRGMTMSASHPRPDPSSELPSSRCYEASYELSEGNR